MRPRIALVFGAVVWKQRSSGVCEIGLFL